MFILTRIRRLQVQIYNLLLVEASERRKGRLTHDLRDAGCVHGLLGKPDSLLITWT